MRLFNKLASGATRLFNKVSEGAPRLLGKLSNGLSSASNFATQVASHPIIQAGASLLPYGNAILSGINQGAKLLNQGSQLTNTNTYSSNPSETKNQILERVKNIKNTLKTPTHQFA